MSAVLNSNVKVCLEALIIKPEESRSHTEGTNRVRENSQSFSLLHIFCKIQILLYLAEVNFVITRCYSVVCGECPLNQVGSLLCSLYLIITLFKEMRMTIILQFSLLIYSLCKSACL